MAKQEKGQDLCGDPGFTGIPVVDVLITAASLVVLGAAYYFLHPDQHPGKYY